MVKGTHNPYWDSFNISLHTLNGGDPKRSIFIEVYDHKMTYSFNFAYLRQIRSDKIFVDHRGKHELVGHFETTLADIVPGKEFDLVNPSHLSKKHYKNSGKWFTLLI